MFGEKYVTSVEDRFLKKKSDQNVPDEIDTPSRTKKKRSYFHEFRTFKASSFLISIYICNFITICLFQSNKKSNSLRFFFFKVYHHCLFGTRYDFLCANFTAFDQKTFICHFVSEVDCANSKKYWHRNDALYKATTTSTTSTSTTTTVAPVTAAAGRQLPRDRDLPRRRRPFRRRPAYDYYDEEYYDDDYSRPRGYSRDDYDYDDRKYRRDRDRDFRDRDRDFRDREVPRSREGIPRDERDRDASTRDRYPPRSNRRDPTRARDPLEEDTRVRSRDPDQGSRSASRELDDAELDDRRTESRLRDTDDRRYSDKR